MKQTKNKPESGFFSTLGQLMIIGFLLVCLGIVFTHSPNTVPSPRTEDISSKPQEQIVDVSQMIELHTKNKKIVPKPYSQKEMICLAKNLFFESRGADTEEQIRIINVTTNRVKSYRFGDTYCDVVYQHAQFSWTLNMTKHNIARYATEHSAWLKAQKMATYELQFGYPDITKGSLYYHTHDVDPDWAHDDSIKEVLATNYHIYYTHY